MTDRGATPFHLQRRKKSAVLSHAKRGAGSRGSGCQGEKESGKEHQPCQGAASPPVRASAHTTAKLQGTEGGRTGEDVLRRGAGAVLGALGGNPGFGARGHLRHVQQVVVVEAVGVLRLVAVPSFGGLLEARRRCYWCFGAGPLPSFRIIAVRSQEGLHGAVSEQVYPSACPPRFALVSWMPWGLSSS